MEEKKGLYIYQFPWTPTTSLLLFSVAGQSLFQISCLALSLLQPQGLVCTYFPRGWFPQEEAALCSHPIGRCLQPRDIYFWVPECSSQIFLCSLQSSDGKRKWSCSPPPVFTPWGGRVPMISHLWVCNNLLGKCKIKIDTLRWILQEEFLTYNLLWKISSGFLGPESPPCLCVTMVYFTHIGIIQT